MKWIRYLTLAVVVAVASSASGQTNTPTETPTATRTPTNTVTPTPTRPAQMDHTDFSAYHRGGFKFDAGTTPGSALIVIDGLKPGDELTIYPEPSQSTVCSVAIVTNNTARVSCIAASDYSEADYEYLWFNRTQFGCPHAPYCGRAFTVTPTPTP